MSGTGELAAALNRVADAILISGMDMLETRLAEAYSGVDRSTLHRLHKAGELAPAKIGGRVFYSKNDLANYKRGVSPEKADMEPRKPRRVFKAGQMEFKT